MIEIIDDFCAHFNLYHAMKEREKFNSFLVKDEGNLLHINQAYNNEVAKSDKHLMGQNITFLRNFKFHVGSIHDQWALVHAVLVFLHFT